FNGRTSASQAEYAGSIPVIGSTKFQFSGTSSPTKAADGRVLVPDIGEEVAPSGLGKCLCDGYRFDWIVKTDVPLQWEEARCLWSATLSGETDDDP
ncbi:MAG: hypothetical protein WBV64_05005, partial [Mycobacterium sp.]